MPLYRVRLSLSGPLATPLTSGTIFGHLCWAKRDGCATEAAFAGWLHDLAEQPWAVSDGFPADHLPRPLLATSAAAGHRAPDDRAKERARRGFLPVAEFVEIRRRLDAAALDAALDRSKTDPATEIEQVVAHNTIDRRRGRTPETGGLYFMDELWPKPEANERDLYVETAAAASEIESLFNEVGAAGFGRDATYGRGSFRVGHVGRADDLGGFRGNRRLSLSHGTLSANMTEPRYRLFTHFGKLGWRAVAASKRPWKRPVLLMRPGATFRPANGGPFGAILRDVHQDDPAVIHNALHVSIPYNEPALPQ